MATTLVSDEMPTAFKHNTAFDEKADEVTTASMPGAKADVVNRRYDQGSFRATGEGA